MGFLLPLGFLFALSIPVLILFYLLKVKRRPRRISSTWLWRATIEDARANVPFQKLRRNLLMILQVLVLGLLAVALARPILNMKIDHAGSVLILIDTSASMAMTSAEDGKTRLEEAREKAVDLVNALPDQVQVLILPYASRASVAVPFTRDRARSRRGLEDLRVHATHEDLRAALVLAASLVGSEPSPQIVIFSDSAVLGPSELEILDSVPVVVEPCGASSANFGWTAVSVQKGTSTAETYNLFGQIVLYGDAPLEVTMKIKAEEKLLDVRNLTLQPGAETPVVVEGLVLAGEPVVHASLSAEDSQHDSLALDNDVWIRVRPSNRIRLLLCSPGNYFLSRALNTIEELDIVTIAPGAKAPEGPWDIAIFDRGLPESAPEIPAVFIGWSPWDSPVETEATPVGSITHWDSEHPVARNIQWSTLQVFSLRPIEPPPGTRALVESGEIPILLVGRAKGQPLLFLTFDLFDSNFPLRSAFPIFIRNAVNWLTRDRAARETEFWNGGRPLTFALPPDASSAKLVSPDNRVWELDAGPDGLISFAETYETGVWKAEIAGYPDERFAVNLLDPKESTPSVTGADQISAEGTRIAQGLGSELRANREIWRWLAVAALLLLLIEWYFYRRPRIA